MKERKSNEKGVSLVALVVTVIILMILAGVAISIGINQNNIFTVTNFAKEQWNEAISQEESALSSYLNTLDGNSVTKEMILEFIDNDDVCWDKNATEFTEKLQFIGYYSGRAEGSTYWNSSSRVFRCTIDDNLYITGYVEGQEDEIEVELANWDGTITYDNEGRPISLSTPYRSYQFESGYHQEYNISESDQGWCIYINPPFDNGSLLLYNTEGKVFSIQWLD